MFQNFSSFIFLYFQIKRSESVTIDAKPIAEMHIDTKCK